MDHKQKIKTTGVILASGEGSRLKTLSKTLGVPKHLFPIGNATIITRIANELHQSCDELLCITKESYLPQYREAFKLLPFAIKVISKEAPGFRGDFMATKEAKYDHIVLTVGDLIFPEGELTRFVTLAKSKDPKALICLDQGQLKKLDMRIIMASYPKSLLSEVLPLNPESLASMSFAFLKNFLRGRVALALSKTLFNINTEESYQKAKEFFSSNKNKNKKGE
ncbi:MAG: NTP transferase domain-containing protein [Oligoflexia bacterium]|nr:NTP transferase domain-containing protein [Oligoflexia bacterium]